ncbi:MAG: hypothetical protein DMG79_05440 [Acidobacteria bacterium]|nr:MAG: hypothetical protein DMG79_05440 [Acidobacteriota bacterium]
MEHSDGSQRLDARTGNDARLATVGFSKTNSAFENLVHPDDRARVIDFINCIVKSGKQQRENGESSGAMGVTAAMEQCL